MHKCEDGATCHQADGYRDQQAQKHASRRLARNRLRPPRQRPLAARLGLLESVIHPSSWGPIPSRADEAKRVQVDNIVEQVRAC